MDVDEDYVHTLLNMGFPSEVDIRQSLQMGKNDLNEAVAILTNEHPTLRLSLTVTPISFDNFDCTSSRAAGFGVQEASCQPSESDSARKMAITLPSWTSSAESSTTYKPTRDSSGELDCAMAMPMAEKEVEEETLEFPVVNLIELESRVFTESWSIPYKEEESLAKCLKAATKLAKEGLCESDEHCSKFINKCLPECFQKLLTAAVVQRWDADIHEGIYNMLQLLVDLVTTRLQQQTVPITLLQVLAVAFTSDTEFHTKNRCRRCDGAYWERQFGVGKVYAVSPTGSSDPHGWLCHLINKFAEQKGFDAIRNLLSTDNLDAPSMAALLAPIGACTETLNSALMKTVLRPVLERSVNYVKELTEDNLREKKIGAVCGLLASMKLMCLHLWPQEVATIDELRLDVVLRLLKSAHFNARMNSLKELAKLIDDGMNAKGSQTAISEERVATWLVSNRVLSIALEGNIDQGQYCDKVKKIMDFIGSKLSLDELAKIWKMQSNETSPIVENIHAIVAAGAIKFNSQQLEHLFILIQKSWQIEDNRHRVKLLSLIGRIGRDCRSSKTTSSVLELLWDLAHLPVLPTSLVQQALDEHLAILNDSFVVKEATKKSYVIKCVDDIKEGKWVLPALKQLLQITKNIAKHSYHKAEKGILQELNKTNDIIKLVTTSLMKFHQLAAEVSDQKVVATDTHVDARYSHKDYVDVHLSFLQFVLQEGGLYLPWHRARDLWDTLVDNPTASAWDTETCYDWLTAGVSDLEQDSQSQLFQKEILQLNPAKLSNKGFSCFCCFFEKVNQNEHRLKKSTDSYVVEKADLLGVDFLWDICLRSRDDAIAEAAVAMLIKMSYLNLAPRLKRDVFNLHKKFIDECYSRLEAAMIPLSASAIAQVLSAATRVVTAVAMSGSPISPSPSRSSNLLSIERLLLVAQQYVLSVEDLHTAGRAVCPPHAATFPGLPLLLHVSFDSPKLDFDIKVHSNESIGSVRLKVAQKVKMSPDSVQLVANDKMLTKHHKLLYQLQFGDHQHLSARSSTIPAFSVQENCSSASTNRNFNREQERQLPGVVMSQGGYVYKMLYQLAELEQPKITSRAASLLKLIPTDPCVKEELENLGQKNSAPSSDGSESPRTTPKNSPRKLAAPSSCWSTRGGPRTSSLKRMFDTSADDMSTFRVLYNLQVLSGQLTPSAAQVSSPPPRGSRSFCDEFVAADGISLVVGVLQQDAIAADADYGTRQGCYTRALQLLRFLLCGQDVNGETLPVASSRDRHFSSGSAGGAAVESVECRTSQQTGPASKVIQQMSVADFTDMIACFMRIAWAAAAGQLHLASGAQSGRGDIVARGVGYKRQTSTSSTASSGSDADTSGCLRAGVCAPQAAVSPQDAHIACDALGLLVTTLQLRTDLLGVFYSQLTAADFIIDVLVGSSQSLVRDAALRWFDELRLTEPAGRAHDSRRHLLAALLHARLPFWVSSSNTRGASHRLLNHCSQYFELRCRLLQGLSLDQGPPPLQLDVSSMMDDELGWLTNFVPSPFSEPLRRTDAMLQEGHLKLIRTLLTCEGVDKTTVGNTLLHDLLHEFLFPASKLISDDQASNDCEAALHSPRFSQSESRAAAYDLLVELARDCLPNMRTVCRQLVKMHHHSHPDSSKQWEHLPPVLGRAPAGFVGLKNGGATCYMNAVLQQLYLCTGVNEAVLAVDDDSITEDSVFYQVQQMFGQLLDSQLQCYTPDAFWDVFRLWGQAVNVREQQDAFDFYTAIIDQMDEQMKVIGEEPIFKKKFQGVFSDQKICKDCEHRYEREEVFFALNVTVKDCTLQDSLDQFVKAELLDADNAFFCEKCNEKRSTVKRLSIKRLPPILCIQLKRFDYDWEANRALKFDDHFKFPWTLNMAPYMADRFGADAAAAADGTTAAASDDDLPPAACSPGGGQLNYELVGVVVHSGQASAGHYYSYIKDRRGTPMTNRSRGKWFKFNDAVVESFEMTEAALEAECFGGNYKVKVLDQVGQYPEERLRYWNAYLLFYERVEEVRTPISSAKKTMTPMWRSGSGRASSSLKRNSDSLVELTELVHKGEKRGLFSHKMPARVARVVRDDNLRFVKNRDVYDANYFSFLLRLANVNLQVRPRTAAFGELSLESVQLSTKFLLNTYLRTEQRLRVDMSDWLSVVSQLIGECKAACVWLVSYLATDHGDTYIRPMLLECPEKEIREAFGEILINTMRCFFQHGGVSTQRCFSDLVEALLALLTKDVVDNYRNCQQYFKVLHFYVQMGTKACSDMNGKNAFHRLASFLLGQHSTTQNTDEGTCVRRWNSLQARHFGDLHATLAILILNCDVTAYQLRSDEGVTADPAVRRPVTVSPQVFLKMSPDMHRFVFGAESTRYIREVVLAVREVGSPLPNLDDMILCCSHLNSAFSMLVLKNIITQYTTAPANELQSLFALLIQILLLGDSLQQKRLQCVIDGYVDEQDVQYEGLLAVIKTNHLADSCRSYQCIKFLVTLVTQCSVAKEYLLHTTTRWHWAVTWLRNKMSDYYSISVQMSSIASNDDSTSKSFQRTMSAQKILVEATALLTELDSIEQDDQMETDCNDITVTFESPSPPPSLDAVTR